MITSKSEIYLKKLLNEFLPGLDFIDNFRPDWLCNPKTGKNLELDRYYPEIGLGIEFNGPQHRRGNNYYQWAKDKIKTKLCGNQGVTRMVFYYKELKREIIAKKLQDYIRMRVGWLEGKSYTRN